MTTQTISATKRVGWAMALAGMLFVGGSIRAGDPPAPGAAFFSSEAYGAKEADAWVTVYVERYNTSPSSAPAQTAYISIAPGPTHYPPQWLATPVADYGSPSEWTGQVSWAANDFSAKPIIIPLVLDNLPENSESFELYISEVTNGFPAYPRLARVDILDSVTAYFPAGEPSVKHVVEGGAFSSTIVLSRAQSPAKSVHYSLTGIPPGDIGYSGAPASPILFPVASASQNVTFAPSQPGSPAVYQSSVRHTYSLKVQADTASPTRYWVGSPSLQTIQIIDDMTPQSITANRVNPVVF